VAKAAVWLSYNDANDGHDTISLVDGGMSLYPGSGDKG
jgi:hypothetical protein